MNRNALPEPLSTIAHECNRRRISEKWLVAPSRRIGQQWIERIALADASVLNLHVFSLPALATQLAGPSMATSGKIMTPPGQSAWWLEAAWRERLRGKSEGQPLSGWMRMTPRPALCEAICRSFHALRMSKVKPTDIAADATAEDRPKLEALADLLDAYLAMLDSRHRIDLAEVYRLAASAVRDMGLPRDVTVLCPQGIAEWTVEHDLLDAVNQTGRLIGIPAVHELPDESSRSPIAWLLNPASRPKAESGIESTEAEAGSASASIEVYRAIGEANELRECMRRVLSRGVALDEVEILTTDSDTYVPLCVELGPSWRTADLPDGPAFTFADGIPARYTRPGRSLLQWLRWIDEDFPQNVLVDMYQEGLFDNLPGSRRRKERSIGAPSSRQLAKLLRRIPIGRTRARYLPAIDREIGSQRMLLRTLRSAAAKEITPSDTQDDIEYAARRLLYLRLLRRHVKQVLSISPEFKNASQSLRQADAFLKHHVPRKDAVDSAARSRLRAKIHEALEWLALSKLRKWQTLGWLLHLARETSVYDQGPRPGAVHVSPLRSGGHSGRRCIFVLGLDDTRFPGAGMQDPVLLDDDRTRISPDLPLGRDEPQRRLERLRDLLASLSRRMPEPHDSSEANGSGPVQLTLSCPSESLEDSRDVYPTPPLVTAKKLANCDERHWRQPVSFVPRDNSSALVESEWWAVQLAHCETTDAVPLLATRFPHLADGRQAVASRFGERMSAFNGWVPDAGAELSPFVSTLGETERDGHRGWSASAMETAGACPLRFFFKYGLKIRPADDLVFEEDRWLDPLQFGSLMHEVFRAFMQQLTDRDESPTFDAHHHELAVVLQQALEAELELHPPPSESAYRQQARQMQIAAKVFLEEEERHCRTRQPRFFESAIGCAREENGPLDSAQPLVLRLDGSHSILALGRVDRIDQLRDNDDNDDNDTFEVWDYKTGSSSRYNRSRPFAKGQHIQNTFYQLLVQAALRQSFATDASVVGFGYFFPSATTWGSRIAWTEEELAGGPAVLRLLGRIMGGGVYLPAWSDKTCAYCDYKDVCGEDNLYRLTRSAQRQLESPPEPHRDAVDAWKELQNAK